MIFTLFLTGMICRSVYGAYDSNQQVHDIIIVGNEKTHESVILREMETAVGDEMDMEILKRDQQRIENLQLFNRVEIEMIEQPDGVTVLVMVTERWYIFPYPILYANERDWKKLSYGAGIVHSNFRGRNTNIGLSGRLGYNPGFSLYYANPWVGGDAHLYLTLKAFFGTVRSRGLEVDRFDMTSRGGLIDIGKRWGLYTYTSVVFSYQQIGFPFQYDYLTASGERKDRLPALALVFKYDRRDLVEYPKKGLFFQTYVEKVYYPSQVDYLRSGIDARCYIPLPAGISLAVRGAGDLLDGDNPMYARHYLGYSERIRGHYSRVRQGDYRLLSQLELRFPIVSLHYFSVDESMFGPYSSNMPFALHGAVFAETGTTWSRGEQIDKERFLSGYGAGIHIQLPYSYVLRFDYGLNLDGDGEFIFDINAWF